MGVCDCGRVCHHRKPESELRTLEISKRSWLQLKDPERERKEARSPVSWSLNCPLGGEKGDAAIAGGSLAHILDAVL